MSTEIQFVATPPTPDEQRLLVLRFLHGIPDTHLYLLTDIIDQLLSFGCPHEGAIQMLKSLFDEGYLIIKTEPGREHQGPFLVKLSQRGRQFNEAQNNTAYQN